MLSFDEALSLLAAHPFSLKEHQIAVNDALGFYLSEDLHAPIDLPSFDNSAVDGFAVRSKDLCDTMTLPLGQTIRAGRQEPLVLPSGFAAKIMTGAPLPLGTDAVIMKEDSLVEGDFVRFLKAPHMLQHIRFRGEDIAKNTAFLAKGSLITPQHIGLLLGLGHATCKVFAKARVRIIATGDELVVAGKSLHHGEVYFLVGPMLRAQCHALGLEDVTLLQVLDDQDQIEKAIKDSLDAELVLISGGMSKGDRDLVWPSLARVGIEQIFYQGRWRPGKPLYFGLKNNTRIFGLPGNPVAAFMCFRIFVQELLSHTLGSPALRAYRTAILGHDVEKKSEFSIFARARVNAQNELILLDQQGSHHLGALVAANALCHLPAGYAIVKANEAVKYYAI